MIHKDNDNLMLAARIVQVWCIALLVILASSLVYKVVLGMINTGQL